MVLSLDLVDSICKFLAESFVFIALDSNRRGLDVAVVRPSRALDLNLAAIFVVDDAFALVKSLVEGVELIFVAERRANLLLDDPRHGVCDLIGERIQKFVLRPDLLLG